jgi:F-type H+-transporting ATPase subunit epsilon
MIHFQLVSTKGTKFSGDAYEVLVPTKDGTIAIFPDHMPLISAGSAGVIGVRKEASDSDDQMEQFAVSGGVVQVDGKTVRYLSDEVTTPDDISEAEAEAAHKLAEELMGQAETQVAVHEARQRLLHTRAKLHVARLRKHRHP